MTFTNYNDFKKYVTFITCYNNLKADFSFVEPSRASFELSSIDTFLSSALFHLASRLQFSFRIYNLDFYDYHGSSSIRTWGSSLLIIWLKGWICVRFSQ